MPKSVNLEEGRANEWLKEHGLPSVAELQKQVEANPGYQAGIVPAADELSLKQGVGGVINASQRAALRDAHYTIPEPEHMKPLPPPVTRTNPARVASLVSKLVAHYTETGSLGLDTPEMKEVLGESWKSGNPLVAADIERIAMKYLGVGEQTNDEAAKDRKVKEIDKQLRMGQGFVVTNRAQRRAAAEAEKKAAH